MTLRHRRLDVRADGEGQEWNQQAPCQQASREVQGGESGADDVSHAKIGRADVGCREQRGATGNGCSHIWIRAGAEQQLLSESADLYREVVAWTEDIDRSQQIHEGAEAHVGE